MYNKASFRGRFLSILRRIRGFRFGRSGTRHALVGRPDLWEMKRQFQLSFLTAHGLKPGHRLLDIGCGTLRGGIPIIEYLNASNYTGVDAREIAIREAQRELEDAGLTHKSPSLIYADSLRDLNLGDQYEFAWAFSVLIHLEDDILDDCLFAVSRYLRPTGHFFANVNIGVKKTAHWDRFPVVSRSMEFYSSHAGKHGLQIDDLGTLGELGHDSGIAEQDNQRMLRFSPIHP